MYIPSDRDISLQMYIVKPNTSLLSAVYGCNILPARENMKEFRMEEPKICKPVLKLSYKHEFHCV